MRSAFRGFEGEILETGYPRNDALNSPEREAIRARVRAALGIEDGQRAVLYAPTWRDNLYHEQGPGRLPARARRGRDGPQLGDVTC
jgi:CDP-glycerol glycerophosphotransferase